MSSNTCTVADCLREAVAKGLRNMDPSKTLLIQAIRKPLPNICVMPSATSKTNDKQH